MKNIFRESILYGIGGIVLLVGGVIKSIEHVEVVGLIFILYANLIERIDDVKNAK